MRNAHEPPGESLVAWLAQACMQTRERAGVSRERIADLYGRHSSAVDRFEAGKTQPQHIDRMLKAYSEATGIAPLVLVKRALALWELNGPPRFSRFEPASPSADN